MASLTSRRMPSARPLAPSSLSSCRTVFKSSGWLWWVILVLSWMCFATPQQETTVARPRPVLRARGAPTPPGCGCARLATLAFAPPHPGGVGAEEGKTNYRKSFTPPDEGRKEGKHGLKNNRGRTERLAFISAD